MPIELVTEHLAARLRVARKQAERATSKYLAAAADSSCTARRLALLARKAATALNRVASVGVLPVRFR